MKESPRSLKIAGVGTRSAQVWRAFELPGRGGSHAAGIRKRPPHAYEKVKQYAKPNNT